MRWLFCYILHFATFTMCSGQVLDLYKIKSAEIVYKTRGSTINNASMIRVWFDDYGLKETSLFYTNEKLPQVKAILIKLQDVQYMQLDSVQIIKSNRKQKFALGNSYVSLIDSAKRREYNIVVDTVRTYLFLNHKCHKYTFVERASKVEGELLVWNGIPLRIVLKRNGLEEVTEAVELNVGKMLPNRIFEVQGNAEIIDMTSMDNG